jgi:hypothetical protein
MHSESNDALGGKETGSNRASDGASMPQQYTSSSGLTPQVTEPAAEPSHKTFSTGLLQDVTSSYAMQSAASVPNGHDSATGQGVNMIPSPETPHPSNIASAMPYQNINTPLFDFGNSEWTDFMQANDAFDSSISLPHKDSVDPYIGFDIPFWLGQDQYQNMLQDRN